MQRSIPASSVTLLQVASGESWHSNAWDDRDRPRRPRGNLAPRTSRRHAAVTIRAVIRGSDHSRSLPRTDRLFRFKRNCEFRSAPFTEN
jgi:hypothetical protein